MAEINPEIFRGYDIRGIYPKDIDVEVMEKLGKAHGTYLNSINVGQAVIGYDNRVPSEKLHLALIDGLCSMGINVIDLGLSLSPIVYWAQYFYKSRGSVMLTGSHNPVEYTGVKLGRNYSDTLTPTQEIRRITSEDAYEGQDVQGSIEKATGYIDDYYKDLISKVHKIKPFKVVVDAANSTAGKFYPELLRQAGCEVIEQNCELDGTFPNGTPDPTEEKFAQRLAERVVKEKADIGFSFDSDGDRIGVADDKGNIIWNDVLIAIFADDAISQKPGAEIIYNCLCSRIVEDVIKRAGGKPIMWMTGHAFIKAKINKIKAPFGGELSGHFYFMDKFYGHDDGGYAALRILDYLTRKNKKMSEVVAAFPHYISSPEVKIACPDKDKFDVIRDIAKKIENDFSDQKISTYDNPKQDVYVRVDFADGMIVARPSQNGPYMTIKFEAKDKDNYEKRRVYLRDLLKKYPEIDFNDGVNENVLA